MTTSTQHVQRAKHNQKFCEQFNLDSTEFLDWVVTAYFYSALHWVEAYLIFINKRPENHAIRNNATNTELKLTPISRAYRKLYSYGLNVRYDLVEFTPERIRNEVIPKVLHIRSHIENLLPKSLY